MQGTTFDFAQQELLNVTSHISEQKDIDDLQQVLFEFFARRVDEDFDNLVARGQWSQEKQEELLHTHYRTPYK